MVENIRDYAKNKFVLWKLTQLCPYADYEIIAVADTKEELVEYANKNNYELTGTYAPYVIYDKKI